AIGAFAIETDIADLPVKAAIGAHLHARHAVAAETHMDTIAVGNGCFLIGDAVTIGVGEPPQVGRYGQVEVIAVGKNTTGHIGNLLVEIVHNQLRPVGHAVTGNIFYPVHFFFLDGEIAPVVRTITVQVGQPRIARAVLRR